MDTLCRITVHNRSSRDAALHVLPTLWFRNIWSWRNGEPKPRLARIESPYPVVRADHRKGTRNINHDDCRRVVAQAASAVML
jgi:hypothetical protein